MLSFILISENRKKIVKTLLDYPKRQWSCSSVEDLTKLSHATVYRTLQGLKKYGLLKTTKINKKDNIYEITKNSSLIKEIKKLIDIDKNTAKTIIDNLIKTIKSPNINSIILYGSTVKGNMNFKSDIDLMILLKEKNKLLENKIYDKSGEISNKFNKTISPIILTEKEFEKEKEKQFIKDIQKKYGVLYGKDPF